MSAGFKPYKFSSAAVVMPNRPYLGREVGDIAMYNPHVSGSRGAVAVSLVLGVVEPYHSGIGGGGA